MSIKLAGMIAAVTPPKKHQRVKFSRAGSRPDLL
jgi:hypothetical protein